jgi:processive 1,2-diacylglycerol beta-glucosyltransferase
VNGLLAEAAFTVGARTEVVLTDWHLVHAFWVALGVDYYTAPTVSARDDCVRAGAPPDTVDVVGIPVRSEFATFERSRRKNDRFTILAMVGAEGSPRALRNIAELALADIDAELIVVCGRSDELRRQVEQLPSRIPVRAFGFVDDVASLMRSADLLLTKAGGVTLAEAFCCGVPVVIHDVLPGQEAGNLEYVLQRGAVMYAERPAALVQIVDDLVKDAGKRAQLTACGARLARPNAAHEIAGSVLRRLVGV